MLYFAYGSNLNVQQMKGRCPAARPIGRLDLPDFRLVFRGVADIEVCEGATVTGGLWDITKRCEEALDIYEGIKSGLYFKHYFPVQITRNGKRVTEDVLVYIMSDGERRARPYRGYFETICEGYRNFGLDVAPLLEATRISGPRGAEAPFRPEYRPNRRQKAKRAETSALGPIPRPYG